MEGDGGSGGSSWDLGISWSAPPTSACQPFPPQLLLQQQLGKRPFFWGGEVHELAAGDQTAGTSGSGGVEGRRKERALGTGAAVAAVPRCQVVGCHVALAGAKEYHRRHKVCELHSKAPRVVVLGVEQRFCQQCNRFHAMTEFDDAKRSCRRRLAGHNERRRKSNASEATARSSTV